MRPRRAKCAANGVNGQSRGEFFGVRILSAGNRRFRFEATDPSHRAKRRRRSRIHRSGGAARPDGLLWLQAARTVTPENGGFRLHSESGD
ncbi:hypothetical protein VTN77DRAFT_3051 [Rasamsonia byssochlamydoides]|uniref:uncharacterized protein n=1 Tax=Rasamsonia byssochlamydoides TaxID=89139 RepID=UPI0037426A2E